LAAAQKEDERFEREEIAVAEAAKKAQEFKEYQENLDREKGEKEPQ